MQIYGYFTLLYGMEVRNFRRGCQLYLGGSASRWASAQAAINSLFDSRGSVFRVKLSSKDITEIEGVREVVMATNFGTTLAANGFRREITTWVFRIKGGLFSVNPASVGRSPWIRSCGVRTASGGRLSGWELTR